MRKLKLPDLNAAQAQETSGLRPSSRDAEKPEGVAGQSSAACSPEPGGTGQDTGRPGMLLEKFVREDGAVTLD